MLTCGFLINSLVYGSHGHEHQDSDQKIQQEHKKEHHKESINNIKKENHSKISNQ